MNAVVIISCGRDQMLELTLPSVIKYCETHNFNLEVIREPIYNFGERGGYNYGTFEKFQCFNLFEKYDRILRLDADIIVTPSAPNIFEFVPNENIGVVNEDVGRRQRDRRKQIENIKTDMGGLFTNIEMPKHIKEWKTGYFNSGVVVASKEHALVFKLNRGIFVRRFLSHPKKLGPFKEQTLLNWRVRLADIPLTPLCYKFNHMSMFTEMGKDPKNSWFIHYAGPQHGKIKKIKKGVEYFYGSAIKK